MKKKELHYLPSWRNADGASDGQLDPIIERIEQAIDLLYKNGGTDNEMDVITLLRVTRDLLEQETLQIKSLCAKAAEVMEHYRIDQHCQTKAEIVWDLKKVAFGGQEVVP
jgi:hypothetical protein